MNERIKELAKQADWWKPLGLPSDWNEGDYVVSPEQLKKFAELIVRECAGIADSNDNGSGDEWDKCARGISRDIKLTFGVEE